MKLPFFDRQPQKKDSSQQITIVSGLPRSGTSLMMKMLAAGGLEPLTDGLRSADTDNPKGYYEFERVKKLPEGDIDWLPQAQGKAVKVISSLLVNLPAGYAYCVIFMRRHTPEILASQKEMLIRRGEPVDKVSDKELAELYALHLQKTEAWLARQPNMKTLFVLYNQLVADPQVQIEQINQFLGGYLDTGRMAQAIDPKLYRQKG